MDVCNVQVILQGNNSNAERVRTNLVAGLFFEQSDTPKVDASMAIWAWTPSSDTPYAHKYHTYNSYICIIL